jgi:hypothetical protein
MLEAVARADVVGEQDADVEDPRGGGHEAAREPRGQAEIDVEDQEDLEGGEAVQRGEEDEGEAEVEGRALVQAGGAPGGAVAGGPGREDGFVELAAQGVEDQEEDQVGQVAAECAVLVVGYVLLERERG